MWGRERGWASRKEKKGRIFFEKRWEKKKNSQPSKKRKKCEIFLLLLLYFMPLPLPLPPPLRGGPKAPLS